MATPKKMRAKSIGHYILGKTIGEGTFGKVKLGTHILTGEKVAVKILEKERIVDVADVQRVAREIHILKLLQHPHVIQLYEIIETPRQLYLIMEYCNGGELFDYIVANGRVKEREACRFLNHILAGVEQIHRMNVVHRDLKPENLLLDEQRNIKIVDFGLSNTFQDGQLLKTACGSPCYAAPEMIAGHRYVPSLCDLWSCGVILFALVCGYLPFEDQNTAALYRKILNADYQPPKFISDSVRDLVGKLLTTDPEQRFTVVRVRAHAWYRQIPECAIRAENERGERMLEEDVLEQLDKFGFPRDYAVKCLQMNKHNHVTTTYYLLAEKKHRLAGRIMGQSDVTMQGDFSGGAGPQAGHPAIEARGEIELMAEAVTPSPEEPQGHPGIPKLDLNAGAYTSDADRAGGSSPAPPSARQAKTPDGQGGGAFPAYGQWAQAINLPASPAPGTREASGDSGSAYGATQARAGFGEPPSSAPQPGQHYPYVGGGSSSSHSGRASANSARRTTDQVYNSPRYPGGGNAQGHGQHSPNKRSPIQQTMGFATPRGPVPTPPPSHSAGPSRTSYGGRAEGGTPTGYRTSTPGKRPPPGTASTSAGGESQSARASSSSRPNTSQGLATPHRPSVPATARGPNEARRRQYQGVSDGGPGSARRGSDQASDRPASTIGSARPGSTAGSGAAAAAALAAELCGTGVQGGRSSSAMGSHAAPAPAWTVRPGTSGSVPHGSSARAASASPDVAPSAAPEGHGGIVSGGASGSGAAPLSARDARDEVMRTCRGAFNVSCTSSKAPKQIMQEIQRALTLQRVSYKQASAFLVKCQRQNMRFEVEISHLDHLESIYVVRFRRVAGEITAHKDLCSKILAEMKI